MSTHDDFRNAEEITINTKLTKIPCIFCCYTALTVEELRNHSVNCLEHPAVQAGSAVAKYLGNVLLTLKWVQPALDKKYSKAVSQKLDYIYDGGLKFILPDLSDCKERTFA